jgi:hypothetical protein
VHPKVVQELLGHRSTTLTLDTYSHVVPSLHAEVARHMQSMFRSTPPELDCGQMAVTAADDQDSEDGPIQ